MCESNPAKMLWAERECSELLKRALAEITFTYAEERIYEDNIVTGIINYEFTKNSTIHTPADKAASAAEYSEVRKSRSALRRAAAKKSATVALGANFSTLASVKLEGSGATESHDKSPGTRVVNAATSSNSASNTCLDRFLLCYFAQCWVAH